MKRGDATVQSSKVAKSAGLAKYRALQPAEGSPSVNRDQAEKLPSGWYFNEQKQTEFWQDIEDFEPSADLLESKGDQDAQVLTDLGSTAHRVQALISQFDNFDQEAAMELMQIIGEGTGGGTDEISIINDARNNVMASIEELKEYAEGQTALLDSIKTWFANA